MKGPPPGGHNGDESSEPLNETPGASEQSCALLSRKTSRLTQGQCRGSSVDTLFGSNRGLQLSCPVPSRGCRDRFRVCCCACNGPAVCPVSRPQMLPFQPTFGHPVVIYLDGCTVGDGAAPLLSMGCALYVLVASELPTKRAKSRPITAASLSPGPLVLIPKRPSARCPIL